MFLLNSAFIIFVKFEDKHHFICNPPQKKKTLKNTQNFFIVRGENFMNDSENCFNHNSF